MNIFNSDTYCGSYCGACSISMHEKTDLTDEFAACLGSVPKEDLSCGGCKSDNVYYGCRICTLRSCAREKNIEHCIDCPDYPCKTIESGKGRQNFSLIFMKLRIAWRLSNATVLTTGLIRKKREWLCPTCGTPFSWYASICSK